MTLGVWVKGYRQASLSLTSPPTGWADGLKLPQLVAKTLAPEGCVQNGNMQRAKQRVKSFPRCMAPQSSYVHLSLTSIHATPLAWHQLMVPFSHKHCKSGLSPPESRLLNAYSTK